MRSRQLFPETSWALALNRLMENMSSAPSQGGWLGRAFVGLAGIWSLERGTERQGQAEQVIRTSLSISLLFREGPVFPVCMLEHQSKHGLVRGNRQTAVTGSNVPMRKLSPTAEAGFAQGHRQRKVHAVSASPAGAPPLTDPLPPPAPHLSWSCVGGFSLVWGIAGEDTRVGLGVLWKTLSPILPVALKEAGSSHEGFQSTKNRGRS